MPNLRGTKTDRITIRLPETTLSEIEELAEKSGLYRAAFYGAAIVAGARDLARFFDKETKEGRPDERREVTDARLNVPLHPPPQRQPPTHSPWGLEAWRTGAYSTGISPGYLWPLQGPLASGQKGSRIQDLTLLAEHLINMTRTITTERSEEPQGDIFATVQSTSDKRTLSSRLLELSQVFDELGQLLKDPADEPAE